MTPENFCYWLQGFFEINGAQSLDLAQTQVVKDHLALVFNKVTPKYSHGPLNTVCPKLEKYFPHIGFVPIGTGAATNMYFGGEYKSSIDPKGVVISC